jgi:hypothetical protein
LTRGPAMTAASTVTARGRDESRNGTVLHHGALRLIPHGVGAPPARFAEMTADALTMTTKGVAIGGETGNRLVWERVESGERVANGRVPRGPGSFLHTAAHQARASLLRKVPGAVAREVGRHGCLTDVDAPGCLPWGNRPWPSELDSACPVSGVRCPVRTGQMGHCRTSKIGNIAHVSPAEGP